MADEPQESNLAERRRGPRSWSRWSALLLFQPWLLFIDDKVDEADDAGEVVGTATDGLSQTAFPTEAPTTGTARTTRRAARRAGGGGVHRRRARHVRAGRASTSATTAAATCGSRASRPPTVPTCTCGSPTSRAAVTAGAAVDSWGIYDDGDYVKLGSLKGNIGDQNYEIPGDADLVRHEVGRHLVRPVQRRVRDRRDRVNPRPSPDSSRVAASTRLAEEGRTECASAAQTCAARLEKATARIGFQPLPSLLRIRQDGCRPAPAQPAGSGR